MSANSSEKPSKTKLSNKLKRFVLIMASIIVLLLLFGLFELIWFSFPIVILGLGIWEMVSSNKSE